MGNLYLKEKRILLSIKNKLSEYMNGKYTLDDIYKEIKNGVCGLPLSVRKYVLSHYDKDGNFKNKKS